MIADISAFKMDWLTCGTIVDYFQTEWAYDVYNATFNNISAIS
jgi:hypothetical protein